MVLRELMRAQLDYSNTTQLTFRTIRAIREGRELSQAGIYGVGFAVPLCFARVQHPQQLFNAKQFACAVQLPGLLEVTCPESCNKNDYTKCNIVTQANGLQLAFEGLKLAY
jgi:hypothetical protein